MLQPSTLKFLKDLRKNNNKPWFENHRPQYEAARNDFQQFVQQLIDQHGKLDPAIKTLDAKACLFRINRDVRFSKDKSPYKSNMGASISSGGKKSLLAGYYFHLEPGKAFVGGGMWQPPADMMRKVRQEIDYNWDEFRKLTVSAKFKRTYGDLYAGDDMILSRVPQGFDKESPAAHYLKLKSWIATHPLTDDELVSSKLVKTSAAALQALYPLLKFLNRSLED